MGLAEIALTGALAFLAAAALAPLESMSWWAGWSNAEIAPGSLADSSTPNEARLDTKPSAYVVYLSGIASISGDVLMPSERSFLDSLRNGAPNAKIVSNVFPYSPSGTPLLRGPRLFKQGWEILHRLRLTRVGFLTQIVNLRNFFQVLVSADERYGPIFNFGAAAVIAKALREAGFKPNDSTEIFLIGFSGGAQVAVGAAAYLRAWARADVSVISLGGVMASVPGLDDVKRLYHLYGDRDRVQRLGGLFFPERWRVFAHSAWNRAREQGRIQLVELGPMRHAGRNGYLGGAKGPVQKTFREICADAVVRILTA